MELECSSDVAGDVLHDDEELGFEKSYIKTMRLVCHKV